MAARTVAVDVQHGFRPQKPKDLGAVFRRGDGSKVTEFELATIYGEAIRLALEDHGLRVIRNSFELGTLVGPYETRARAAVRAGATVYLACHVNAGRGDYARVAYTTVPGGALAGLIGCQLARLAPLGERVQMKQLGRFDRGSACIRFAEPAAAVLLEPFFGDNAVHLATLGRAQSLIGLGRAIAGAVLAFDRALELIG